MTTSTELKLYLYDRWWNSLRLRRIYPEFQDYVKRILQFEQEVKQLEEKQPTKRMSMEIVDRRADAPKKEFKDMATDSVFYFKGNFYVKFKEEDAFNLSRNFVSRFAHCDEVTPVKATLTIERLA